MHYNPTLLFCIFFLLFTSCKEKKSSVQTDLPSEFPHSPQTLTLLFCGDIMQHLPQIHSAHEPSEKDYKYRKCFKYIAPYWADADFVIANLETTLGNKDFSGYPRFCSPWQIARDLHQLGVTTFVTANNHSCDQLGKGIANTIYYLDSTYRNIHGHAQLSKGTPALPQKKRIQNSIAQLHLRDKRTARPERLCSPAHRHNRYKTRYSTGSPGYGHQHHSFHALGI